MENFFKFLDFSKFIMCDELFKGGGGNDYTSLDFNYVKPFLDLLQLKLQLYTL